MPHRRDQRLSDRTLTDVVVLLLVAALAFQSLQPLPPFLLGMAIACGLVVGFIPQTGWWLAVVRAIVGVGPISYAVAVYYKGADFASFSVGMAQTGFTLLGISGAVVLLYWRRRGPGAV